MTMSVKELAHDALATLKKDLLRLERIDRYHQGQHDDPYLPEFADDEYKLLAKRSITNVMTFIVNAPAQSMYVDDFRPGGSSPEGEGATGPLGEPIRIRGRSLRGQTTEWRHWQRSRLDARQHAVHRGALKFGHSFTVTERDQKRDKVITKGLSALTTIALYDDPANDDAPVFALTIKRQPKTDKRGIAHAWDETRKYEISYKSMDDLRDIQVEELGPHGATECPVTRFATTIDLEGRTTGVIEPMMPLQDRINQTIFDLLVVQSFASFKVRTVTGMAPPVRMKPIYEDGEIVGYEPELDDNGRPIPDNVNLSARRVFWAEDQDVRFGQLDETPLDGFILAIQNAFQQMAALSQTPPHHLLGQVANISAEALEAAESALMRRVEEFKSSFGESWERVFRLVGEMEGTESEDYMGEVLWRDLGQKSMSQAADALGKLHSELGIPARGLWARIPGTTGNEIEEWERLSDLEGTDTELALSLGRARVSERPVLRQVVGVGAGPGDLE